MLFASMLVASPLGDDSGLRTVVNIADLWPHHGRDRYVGGKFAGQLLDRGKILLSNTLERRQDIVGYLCTGLFDAQPHKRIGAEVCALI